MNKIIMKILIGVIIVLLILGVIYIIDTNRMKNNEPVVFSTWGKDYETSIKSKVSTDMNVVLSLEDEITENTAWCGTFNLIWNDLRNELAKQDIVFTPQLNAVRNLNKGTFSTNDISEESYYKVYGVPSLELKNEIERAIKEKFNETSDILGDFDWKNVTPEMYFLYAMLKKNFEFPAVFTELPDGKFGETKNVKYFGVNSSTTEDVRLQVNVLYYNSKDDFAVKLNTKTNDEVIISTRVENKNTFLDIYNEINEKNKEYKKDKSLTKRDKLQIPEIKFNLKKEFEDLEYKEFLFANGEPYYIEKAIQTIQFELDKKGGKIKSEAGMMLNKSASIIDEPREFIIDGPFVIFLKEKDKNLPYFAANISDISKVQ